jgi:hypothetical protein
VPKELQICQQAPEEDEQKSIQRDYTLGLTSAELARFCETGKIWTIQDCGHCQGQENSKYVNRAHEEDEQKSI